MNLLDKIKLIQDNNLLFLIIGPSIFFFISGILLSFILYPKLSESKRKRIYKYIINKIKRFFKNLIQFSPIIFILIFLYYCFKLFGYDKDMLPELIGAGISVLIINFIIKEKEYNKKSKLDKILNNKLKEIISKSEKMIFKYIDAEEYFSVSIDSNILHKIFKKQDLVESRIKHNIIYENGVAETIEISKIDYLFYIRKDLYPLLNQFVSSYGIYLEYDQLHLLISLQEILDRNIFRTKLSSISEINADIYEKYVDVLVELLLEINKIMLKFKNKGDNNRYVD